MKTSHNQCIVLSFLMLPLSLLSQTPDWNTSGNFADSSSFLGTTNPVDLEFRTDNLPRMYLSTTGNLGIGTSTPGHLLDVAGNMNLDTFNFYRIGGMEALYIDTALNVGVGMFNEMNTITTGKRNIAVGYLSGSSLTDGFQNTFLGTYAGEDVASASNNAFFGECAGRNTTDNSNTMVGAFSGFTNTGGYNNTFLGFAAAYNIASGNHNLMAGSNAGRDLSTGTNHHNVILGADAGYTSGGAVMTAGTTLTLVGYNTEASNSLTNATAIGANAMVEASNAIVIGSINTVNGATVTANVGIGTTTPGNRLEVKHGTSGLSGLRLTNLVTAAPINSTGVVLTIDNNGDVILVKDSIDDGSGGNDWHITGNAGTTAGAPNNNFIGTTDEKDFVIATDNQEWMRVIGETTNQGNVGIHTATPTAVLHVVDSSSASSNTAIYGEATVATTCKAVHGRSEAPSGGTGYGGYFVGDYGATGPLVNYGVYGKAHGGATDYGGYFTVPGADTTGNRYAVYGEAGASNYYYAAYFNGEGVLTGGMWGTSDRKLKKDLQPLSNGLDRIMELKPTKYEFAQSKYPSINLPKGQNYGLIAQDLEEVIPELVKDIKHPAKYNDKGDIEYEAMEYKGVNYTGLISFTIAAIQEQQEMIEEKEARIVVLEKEVERLASIEAEIAGIKQQLNELAERRLNATDTDVQVGIVGSDTKVQTELYQNQPNPFRQNTTFFYTLGTTGNVELNIYSMDGVFIDNAVRANQHKGEYKVEWDSKDIPNGMYFYILTVDGVEWVKKA